MPRVLIFPRQLMNICCTFRHLKHPPVTQNLRFAMSKLTKVTRCRYNSGLGNSCWRCLHLPELFNYKSRHASSHNQERKTGRKLSAASTYPQNSSCDVFKNTAWMYMWICRAVNLKRRAATKAGSDLWRTTPPLNNVLEFHAGVELRVYSPGLKLQGS